MNILVCRWGNLCEKGVIDGFCELGHQVDTFDREIEKYDYDTEYLSELASYITAKGEYDFIFSINFVPIIAHACKVCKVKYISWVVDCPSLQLFSKAISYKTNYVFAFDRVQTEKIVPFNKGHVFHQTLAFAPYQLETITTSKLKYNYNISFVGNMYTKENEGLYNNFTPSLPEYMKGYIDALFDAQLNVFGYNFIEDTLSEKWISDFIKYTEIKFPPEYYVDEKHMISQLILNYKCSEIERRRTLDTISRRFSLDMHTYSDTSDYPQIKNHGGCHPVTEAPVIFNQSKINLNITMRGIPSGISLRVFDVLGCGGFLITNYQPEIAELFVDGEDLVMYTDMDDLLQKIDYYLNHPEERQRIAKNGQKKVLSKHTYKDKLAQIIETVTENI